MLRSQGSASPESIHGHVHLDYFVCVKCKHIMKKSNTELTEVISMLERATSILEKEMSKSGASMLQLKSATSVADALKVMVQASVLSSADASRLTALVQSDDSDADSSFGAPAAQVRVC